jgi:hypothetical protein
MKMVMLMAACLLTISGCTSGQKAESEKYTGREETRKLEGASAVGYDGTAIRKTVDGALNKNDDHVREMNNALKSGGGGEK